jgi:hypothetical protein
MISHSDNKITYFTFKTIPNTNITHAIFGRSGGVSPYPYESLNMSTSTGDTKQNVSANIALAYSSLNVPLTSLRTVTQVHGARIIATHNEQFHNNIEADGLITQTPNTSLFMRFADCAPIMLYDPIVHAIGLGHAGWRGTLAGLASSIVETMKSTFGSKSHNLLAAIGPCITVDHYKVGQEVANLFHETYNKTDDILLYKNDSVYLDILKANIHSLTLSGVQSIETSDLCTTDNNDYFFSHRAEPNPSGRFGAVIYLT